MQKYNTSYFGTAASDMQFLFDFCGDNQGIQQLILYCRSVNNIAGIKIVALNGSVYKYQSTTGFPSRTFDLINTRISKVIRRSGEIIDALTFETVDLTTSAGTSTNQTVCGASGTYNIIETKELCGIYGTFCNYYGTFMLCRVGFMLK